MNMLKFKIPLEVYFDRDVAIPTPANNYSTHVISMENLKFNEISPNDINNLDGQYDWIDAWRYEDWCRESDGFNSQDVKMECVYDKGNYIITLISDKPFDSKVTWKQAGYLDKPEEVTLKEAVVDFLEGCISDGIGENEIGYIIYQGEKCEVWMGKLEEIGSDY